MRNFILTLLLCITLAFNSTNALHAQGNKGNRIAKVLGIKESSYTLFQQLLLTTVFACTTFSCGTVKPHLYTIGILNPSSAMQAETVADEMLAIQRDFDSEVEDDQQVIRNHVYVVKPIEHKIILAEVVKEADRTINIQGYADKYELTIDPEAIEGYLIDDHPNVGRVVKLTSNAVGISHLNGIVFAVYNNGIHAIKITGKTDLDGKQEKLHEKDDAPHVRYAYEYQLQ